ncbi:MAG: hypothetical protein V3V11_03320 [Vicinamibacteria bacterium]
MKRTNYMTFVLVLFGASAVAQEHHHPDKTKKESKGEIRVYLADRHKKPVDLKGIMATVIIKTEHGKRHVLRTKLVTPEGSKKTGLGHGGEVRPMGNYFVEFVVQKPHAHHAEEKHGHEKQGHEKKDATPFFGTKIELHDLKFSAVVIFRLGGKTLNVKGFEYPPAVPDNYKDAVARIEEHMQTIQGLIDTNDLEKVHAVAEKISYVCKKLPALAARDDLTEVETTCKVIIGLFSEIDEAADAGKKRETVQVFGKYKTKVKELKKHVDGHAHH